MHMLTDETSTSWKTLIVEWCLCEAGVDDKSERGGQTEQRRAGGRASKRRESKGGDKKREVAEKKHFCRMGQKQPWKLHQKETKSRVRTKEVPMSSHKEPVQFFSLLCLLGL